MKDRIDKTKQDPNIVVKTGLWYTICNFLFKGIAFITIPVFARLMSKTELGSFSNFASWASILTVVTSFDLAQSIIRSRFEHEMDIDSYIWSILVFSSFWTLIVYCLILLFPIAVSNFLEIDMKYIHIMFAYLLFAPAYQMLVTKQRAFYKYKMFVIITGIMTISGTLFSFITVVWMQDKLQGRILGFYVPQIIISLAIFFILAVRGKQIKIKYWKYACVICVPLVPHILSLYLLGLSGMLIITRLCGAEYTAVYSIAYSAYHIVTTLFDSMNKAWSPWLLEQLHQKEYKKIYNVSKVYTALFVMLIVGILVLVPEVIWVLGGEQYAEAIYCLPALITSCVFQFIYTMYVNIEFYEKKTVGVSIATILATIISMVVNFLLIPLAPEKSYIIASYTTLIGYCILFIFHYFIVKQMKMDHIYDINFILKMLGATFVISMAMNILYQHSNVRYVIIVVYAAILSFYGIRHRETILSLVKKKI